MRSLTGLAPRHRDLSGARVGLLANTKRNASRLLEEIGGLLVAEHGAGSVTLLQAKPAFALPIPEDLLEEYQRFCDVVLTGVGDCGSSSASAIADGILFERAGLPAAAICTEAFVITADTMAELRGAPDYDYVVTEHPLAVLSPDQVRQRAEQLLPEVAALLAAKE